MHIVIANCIIAGIIDIAYVGSQKFASLEAGLNKVKNSVSKLDKKINKFNDKINRFLTDINQEHVDIADLGENFVYKIEKKSEKLGRCQTRQKRLSEFYKDTTKQGQRYK
jgi:predicted translin family RNA/ssDNA-binding protein